MVKLWREKGICASGWIYENIDYNKCFNFNSVKRERPECIKEIRVLLPSFMVCITSLLDDVKWQQI